jgi:hypothetical protein
MGLQLDNHLIKHDSFDSFKMQILMQSDVKQLFVI